MNEKWFAMSVADIERKLKTNATSGLAQKVASSRRNSKEKPFFSVKKKNPWEIILELLKDIFLIVLLIVALISLFFDNDMYAGIAMLVMIGANLAISFYIYYRDKHCVESLTDFFLPTARVIREGKLFVADYRDVVVGDVIIVEKGDVLGCDARLIYSDDLVVDMKIDKTKTKRIQKYAGAAVSEREFYAENMTNMLHAGSLVEKGSGRAVVVATGQYTYLGARIGGIAEISSGRTPDGMETVKKNAFNFGIVLLLASIPFVGVSILLSRITTGGETTLSTAFAAIICVGATLMLSRFSNLFLGFFVRFMRGNALAENPCIIRSEAALDTLSEIDYLFLLDGSITSDGILHYEFIATAEGETREFTQMTQSASVLAELVGIYQMARQSAPTVGINSNSYFDIGSNELIRGCGIDIDALKIRCKVHSYLPMIDKLQSDCLVYSDMGEARELHISFFGAPFEECDYALFSSGAKPLSEEGRLSLKKRYEEYIISGRRPLVFTLKEGERRCFAGMLVLREGIDESIVKATRELQKRNVKIIAFTNCKNRGTAPEIPDVLRTGKRVYASDFISRQLPVTKDFGEFDEYCGFDEAMIAELVAFVKTDGKKLAVLGFSDYAKLATEHADLFITCAPVRTGVFGKFAEEIRALEVPGNQSSASCTQDIKMDADILLSRPKNGKGGLIPLAMAIEHCRIGYKNLRNYLVYLLTVQIIRTISILLPMFFGFATADARHLLMLGFVFDLLMMPIFMTDNRKCNENFEKIKYFFNSKNINWLIKTNKKLFVSAVVGGVCTIVLPVIFDFLSKYISWIKSYDNQAEFAFIAVALMQIVAVFCVYVKDFGDKEAHKKIATSPWFLGAVGGMILFTLVCFIFKPLGEVFGIDNNYLLYFLLSLVPAVVFLLCYLLVTEGNSVKKKK